MPLALSASAAGQTPHSTDVFLFWQRGCTHCEQAIDYLARLEAREPELEVHYFELRGRNNARFYRAAAERLALDRIAVPLIVIGDGAIVGYLDDASTGAEIAARAAACAGTECVNLLGPLAAEIEATDDPALARAQLAAGGEQAPAPGTAIPETTRRHVPFFGEVDFGTLSLPVLTIALAAVDGFNPCALWVLVFLIGLLLGHADAPRRWMLGGLFLLTTGVVYYAVIAAWLNMLLVIGAVAWLRVAIAVVALIGGGYYAYRYFTADVSCRIVGGARRERVFASLRSATREPRFLAAATAIVVLAVGVNFVELLCSAGIPAVYTQLLALTPMPSWQYHAWLAVYVLVFVADDVAIFVTAMLTLQIAGAHRYAHRAQLVGALVLLVVGALLLTRPEWLSFA